MRRLSRAGFKRDFLRQIVLPDWWDESCEEEPDLLPDIEIRVARFLGMPLSAVRDPSRVLASPSYPEVRLRRARNLEPERLAPAIHTAIQVAGAVVRSLRPTVPAPEKPPADGIVWRAQILTRRDDGRPIGLNDVLDDLWKRGIPVVALEILPVPSFQGMACIIGDRPVVLLGQKYDAPGRLAFFIGHEAGHIAADDCRPGRPVVDEDEEFADETDIERTADRYATRALVGSDDVPEVDATTYRDLATKASQIARSRGIDPGVVIFRWARQTGDYGLATMAVQALYRGSGARRSLRRHFDSNVDLESATESDRSLLRCVFGDPERDASPR